MVYGDVVVDERWRTPFDAAQILRPRSATQIVPRHRTGGGGGI
jgi:hypothetical protein